MMSSEPHPGKPEYSVCPGCGARLPINADAQPGARYNASAECWALYGELTAYTVARGDWDGAGEFIHQLAVDAYGAQHVRENARPIGPAFALIGLYLTCERGYTGRQVQHMHTLLANRSKTWPRFVPLPHAGTLTVAEVVRAPEGEARDAVLRAWGCSVWEAWAPEHERVRALFASVMGD